MTSIPIKTALLVPGDDILEVARVAVASAGLSPLPGDILVICGGPLAITQGRMVHVDALDPGLTARVFCRLLSTRGSLGTASGMQTAIDVAGRARIALALAAGHAGRLIGRHGDFYRVAGRQVAWIDHVSATTPTDGQRIILAPDDPRGVAVRMAEAMGCGAAVVEADDMGTVEILGASAFLDWDRLTEAMQADPRGNADEQAPLVLVRA